MVTAAFALTKDAADSEPVQTTDGFSILHLLQVELARPLTLEEARPKIVEALTKRNTQQMLAMKAVGVATKLREEMQSGKPLAEAATAAGVTLEKIPAFALADEPPPGAEPAASPEPKAENPEMPYIKRAASDLSAGQVSNFVPTQNGGLLVILENRETIAPAEYEKSRAKVESQAMENQSQVVFYEWLRERRREAGVPEPKAPEAPAAPAATS